MKPFPPNELLACGFGLDSGNNPYVSLGSSQHLIVPVLNDPSNILFSSDDQSLSPVGNGEMAFTTRRYVFSVVQLATSDQLAHR